MSRTLRFALGMVAAVSLGAKSWDEPPYTGVLTALTFVLAGVVLMASIEQRMRTGSGTRRV